MTVAAPTPARESRFGAYLAFAAICIIWGTTFAAIRVAIETVPTFLLTGIRFLLAGAILLVVAIASKSRFPTTARAWRDQVIAGVLMAAVSNTLVVYAEHELSSGMAALLSATIPVWMVAMEATLGVAAMTRGKVAGLVLGFGGVGLLVAPAIGRVELSTGFLLAVGAMQLNAIAWNAGSLVSRRHRTDVDSTAASVVQMLSGGAAVMLLALVTGARPAMAMFPTRSLVALLYLTIFGSVLAYSAYNYALNRMGASRVSSYAYVNPAIAVVTGAVLLGEPVTIRIVAAMAIILAGVGMIQIDRMKAR